MSDPQEELRSQDSGKSSRGPGRQGTGLGRPPRVALGQGLLAQATGPSAALFPVSSSPSENGGREQGAREGEPCQAGRRLLESWKEPGITESWGRCQPEGCSPGGAAEGGGAAYGAPASSARLCSLPSLLPLCSPGCTLGMVTGGSVCVASSGGLQAYSSPSPSGSHSVWAETQEGEVTGGCGGGKALSPPGQIKEGFQEEVTAEVSWN